MQTRKRAKAVQFGKKEEAHVEDAKQETKDNDSSHESTEVIVSVKEDKVETHIRHGDEQVDNVEELKESEDHTEEDDTHEEQTKDKGKSEEAKWAEIQAANEAFLRATEENEERRTENGEPRTDLAASKAGDGPSSTRGDESTRGGELRTEIGEQASEDTEKEESESEEDVVSLREEKEEQHEQQESPEEERVASKDSFSFTDTDDVVTVEKKKSVLFFFVIAFLAFVVGLGGIAGGYYLLKSDTIDFSKISMPAIPFLTQATPTEEPTPTSEPTAKPVDLKAYTVRILNGSGVTGEAAKLKAVLTDAGFTVGETGNADNSDYTETVISAQTSVDQGYLKELTETLKKSYKVDATVKTVPSVGDSQVTVTIGSETAQ